MQLRERRWHYTSASTLIERRYRTCIGIDAHRAPLQDTLMQLSLDGVLVDGMVFCVKHGWKVFAMLLFVAGKMRAQ
jgi:hypothetical protein